MPTMTVTVDSTGNAGTVTPNSQSVGEMDATLTWNIVTPNWVFPPTGALQWTSPTDGQFPVAYFLQNNDTTLVLEDFDTKSGTYTYNLNVLPKGGGPAARIGKRSGALLIDPEIVNTAPGKT